ncbi:CaiB/BaiF CoA transferase family protein [Roseinatronobacter alkalisoli]|uniref:CaiB/BaiF CoA-transferase family protein n=1 Tax=Roseinatronobacter alkalisoli TaxID=3028235 RepID=A0ABT5T700_9RHOB|nr:CaiB/BaiF CoA-transferase family protein [Roseinatronobacter sp. HJB301]MDD7970888.1 CaiB/BaiF CoA-transferase family protein [Roseinatronobacter sp. HJB301]
MMNALPQNKRPLAGLLVLDFSQYLSGPFCGLKLADLGARVIKVERPGTGDPCRGLFISDPVGGENPLFHAINRNKESITADLRNPQDRARLTALVAQADVLIQNFRPGVIARQGLGYDDVAQINPQLVYGSISGFSDTDWRDLPGQDLLAQARSGLMWLTGSGDHPPMPMGLSVADMLAGEALTQGILAALVGRGVHGRGALVETSLLEALLSLQFEVLTTHLNDGHQLPQRPAANGAHAYIGAPYGVYATRDGHLAIAMTPSLRHLAGLMQIDGLDPWLDDPQAARAARDDINAVIAAQVATRSTTEWLAMLQPADIWCAEVLDWHALMAAPAFGQLDMVQRIGGATGLDTLRGPLRLDRQTLASGRGAPRLGADTARVFSEFGCDANAARG